MHRALLRLFPKSLLKWLPPSVIAIAVKGDDEVAKIGHHYDALKGNSLPVVDLAVFIQPIASLVGF